MHKCAATSDSATPWTAAHQAPLSMEFSRHEYWSGLPFATLRDLSHSGIETMSPVLAGKFFITVPTGKPQRGLHFGLIFPLGAYELKSVANSVDVGRHFSIGLLYSSLLCGYTSSSSQRCVFVKAIIVFLMSNPENWGDVSLEKRTNLLADYYKVVGSQGSMFSCNTTHCIFRHILRPVILTEGGLCSSGALGNINNLRYADDTTLMAESKEKLKNLLI